MGERDRSGNIHTVSLSGSPHGAGEIAEPIRGEQSSLFKGRYEKRARQMRLMMFDAMELRSNLVGRDVKGLRQGFRNADKSSQHLGPLAGEARHLQCIHELCSEARPGIARDGNVVDLGKSDAGGVQAVTDRRGRKTGGVLHAVKTFFLHCGDQTAVGNEGRRGISVIRVDPKYVHPELFSPHSWVRALRAVAITLASRSPRCLGGRVARRRLEKPAGIRTADWILV